MDKTSYLPWRFYLVLFFILLAVLGLASRIFHLAILNQHFLRHEGDERVLRLVSTPSFRGMIVDRNGFPLAVSTKVYSAWVNPQVFDPGTNQLVHLSQLLHLRAQNIQLLIQKNRKKKREFVYLKRMLAPEVASEIKLLRLPGLYLQEEYRRYYPEGEVTAHVIGFTNIDDIGQEGVELAYNPWLQGTSGKKWAIKDRIGRVIADVQMIQDQKPGHDLMLSIDRRIQYLAYRELLAGVTRNQATAGTAIVMDTQTGEILAMVNVPSYNPNNRAHVNIENFRNRAITDTFEPGSTMKAFTVTAALESGKFHPTDMIDTSPGWIRLGHDIVKDPRNHGLMTISQLLQVSSNMGATKLVLALPPDELWQVLHRVGFGESTGIGFPGEQEGALVRRNVWGQFVLATLSFGYGMSATALQVTRAYAVLANLGMKLPVSLLKLSTPPAGERVLSTTVSQQVLALLETVFAKGSLAHAIAIEGYRMAGKSGTSKKVGKTGYEKHHYNSSFVGIAPLGNPRLVVTVILNDPQGKDYYGSEVAGPVFQKIMEGSLRLLDISPDGV